MNPDWDGRMKQQAREPKAGAPRVVAAPPGIADWRRLADLLVRWGDEDDTNPTLYEGDVEWANALAKWLTAKGVFVGAARSPHPEPRDA